LGERRLSKDARLAASDVWHLQTRDISAALADMFSRGVRSVLVEGGPTVAGAFIAEELVDHVVWFVAPALVGQGMAAIEGLGIATIGQAIRWIPISVAAVGADVRLDLRPAAFGNGV
jgi:diaminohydroxyphosphoribosylaminopyrimidine deaminase/5-amino-6-(5-phosphoribosylamino)uracil reductase